MLKKLRQSLITRLMLYFLIAGFLFILLFGINMAHGLKVHFKQEVLPNIAQYLGYIARDIGSPPDLNKAQKLSENLSFEMRITGHELNWQSSENIPSKSFLRLENGPEPYQDYKVAHHHGNNYVLLKYGDYEYLYVIGKLFKDSRSQRSLGLIIVIIVSMSLLFFLIRSSLEPLKVIEKGIKNIAEGDLDSPISVRQSTEFKRLAAGINAMSGQIKTMLEGKQQLLLAISHELRSPLTRAKVNLEIMPPNPVRQALQEDVIEMETLISQILESERLNQRHAVLNKTEFRLDALVEDVIAQYFIDSGISTELEPVSIEADKTRMILLIKNLLDNAIKYTEEGDQPPRIKIIKNESAVILEIEDSGCGIPAEDMQRITQAFYRVDKARQRNTGGFGLGLYLCQLIVTAHQGSMTFKTGKNRGTRVLVELPVKIPE